MNRVLLSLALIVSFSASARETTIYSDYQCWALGNQFRVKFSSKKEYLVESRLAFSLKLNEQKAGKDGEAKLSYIGHVAFKKFVEETNKEIDLFDGYSQFLEQENLSVLSARAKKYTDDKYYRFVDVAEVASTSHDGGGMNGYLVISKKLSDVEGDETFDAHYVFQHGDHTGGTLDYTCKKE